MHVQKGEIPHFLTNLPSMNMTHTRRWKWTLNCLTLSVAVSMQAAVQDNSKTSSSVPLAIMVHVPSMSSRPNERGSFPLLSDFHLTIINLVPMWRKRLDLTSNYNWSFSMDSDQIAAEQSVHIDGRRKPVAIFVSTFSGIFSTIWPKMTSATGT